MQWAIEIKLIRELSRFGLRARVESSEGNRNYLIYLRKGATLGRVTFIADIRNKWRFFYLYWLVVHCLNN
jgi:hypothetical protein